MDPASSEHAFLVVCHQYNTLLVCLGVSCIEIRLHNTSLLQAQVVDGTFALVGICGKRQFSTLQVKTSYAMAGVFAVLKY